MSVSGFEFGKRWMRERMSAGRTAAHRLGRLTPGAVLTLSLALTPILPLCLAFGLILTAAPARADGPDVAAMSSNLELFQSDSPLAERHLLEVPIGSLDLFDGKLVAMDPLVSPEGKPYSRSVKPGRYPVSFLRGTKDGSRIALLVIRFAETRPTTFELAVGEGADLSTLKPGEFFGVPVDAGVASFANSAYAADYDRRVARDEEQRGRELDYYSDVLLQDRPDEASDWHVLHQPMADGRGAAAIVSSGYGDGVYPVFFGLDGQGAPVLAGMDFAVITDGDGRDRDEKRAQRIADTMNPQQQADSREAQRALQQGDEDRFIDLLRQNRIRPKDPAIGGLGSFVFEAIRLDRPRALQALVNTGIDDNAGPDDTDYILRYSEYADDQARQAKMDAGLAATDPMKTAPPSKALMAVVDTLRQRAPTQK